MKTFILTICAIITLPLISISEELVERGETPFPSELNPEYTDGAPARVVIDSKLRGKTVSRDFDFVIRTENFVYEPQAATALPANYADGTRRVNAGHFHVYATLREDSGFNVTNVFLGAPAFTDNGDGTLTTSISLPCEGTWLIFVMAQYDDHTPRIPRHPQQWPTIDTVEVQVRDFSFQDRALAGVISILNGLRFRF